MSDFVYLVDLPDGSTAQCKSHRTYTHAICYMSAAGKWSAASFAGSLELANKEMASRHGKAARWLAEHPEDAGPPLRMEVLPVRVQAPTAPPRPKMRTPDGKTVTISALHAVDEGAADAAKLQTRPTEHGISRAQWGALEAAYQHFNAALFGGELLPVVLNFSRHANSLGFFAPNRWYDSNDAKVTHEISLNPSFLLTRDLRSVMSTLVHEMVHCWQEEHGAHKSKRAYHNREWAAKMESIGLQPTSTGLPGGKRTGAKMTHMVVDGGAYDQAFAAMPDECRLPWLCREPKEEAKERPRSKVKFTCPGCEARAWAKPSASLKCGECDQAMAPEEDGEDDA